MALITIAVKVMATSGVGQAVAIPVDDDDNGDSDDGGGMMSVETH